MTGSVGLNRFLVERVRVLVKLIQQPVAGGELRQGSKVPKLAVSDLQGESVAVSDWGVKWGSVLYVLRPGCVWCLRNEANIRFLAAQAGDHYRFIGISLTAEGLREYVADHAPPFPVYVISPSAAREYNLSGTPETLVVSPSGHLLQRWSGAFLGNNRRAINEFFSTNLDQVGSGEPLSHHAVAVKEQ